MLRSYTLASLLILVVLVPMGAASAAGECEGNVDYACESKYGNVDGKWEGPCILYVDDVDQVVHLHACVYPDVEGAAYRLLQTVKDLLELVEDFSPPDILP